MDEKDKKSGNAPSTNLSIRSRRKSNTGANQTQVNSTSTTQQPQLSSNNQIGRQADHQVHGANGRNPSPTDSLLTRGSAGQASTSTNKAVASETSGHSSEGETIKLGPDPEHEHAREIYRAIEEFNKDFDVDEDDDKKAISHHNGRA